MNTISGSSSYSASASTSKGLSGLASGIDTESMVESMLSGTQSKIDKQTGEKQTLSWKQEMYRDIISSINKFQNKFFDYTSPTNMRSSAFYNAMSALSKSSALKATASSSAPAGKTSIQVAQLATNTKLTSEAKVSGPMEGEIDLSQFDATVVFDVSGTSKTVNLTAALDAATEKAGKPLTEAEKLTTIKDAIGAAGVSAEINAETGALTIKSSSTVRVSSKSNRLGLNMLGLSENRTNDKETGILSGTVDANAKVTIDVTLDDVTKTITLNRLGKGTAASPYVLDAVGLNEDLEKEFGKGQIGLSVVDGKVRFATTDSGREISVSGNEAGLETVGMVAGQSNKIGGGLKLKDISFAGGKLQGDSFQFKINDVTITASGDDTLNSVMSRINNSKAGVTIKYLDLEDKFVMESTSTGKGFDIKMSQDTGNLLGAMFSGKVAAGKNVESGAMVKNTIEGDSAAWKSVTDKDSLLSMVVNGKVYRITVDKKSGGSQGDTEKVINESLQAIFGYAEDGQPAIECIGGKIKVNNGAVVSFDDKIIGELDKTYKPADNLSLRLGLNGKDNLLVQADIDAAGSNTTLGNLGIVPKGHANENTSLKDFMNTINTNTLGVEASFKDGRLVMTSKNSTPVEFKPDSITPPIPKDVMQGLFGSETLSFSDGKGSYTQVDGQNAVVSINGVATERSTNIFTANGIQIELQETTGEYEKDANGHYVKDANGALTVKTGTTEQKAVIETTRNSEQIFKGIQSFVEEYNKLIEDLNTRLDEKASYRDYPPLTEAQKKEMSDTEVTLWEKNSKTGLLRNDSEVGTLLTNLRSALYVKPEGSKFALYDIGIETTSNWKDKGKLVINESTLKQMIEADPKAIETLFTNTSPGGGLTQQLSKAMDKAAKISSGDPGSLVSLAGVVGRATEFSNTLTDRMKSIDDKIKTLKNTYASQKSRYWQQFNSMEKMMANLNTQSSWLTQQFS